MGGEDRAAPPATWWEELSELKIVNARFCENTARRIEGLENWKHDQNGEIRTIREDLAKFKASSQKWLVGLLTSVILALVLLVVNLSVSLGSASP